MVAVRYEVQLIECAENPMMIDPSAASEKSFMPILMD
jgi:hypothetical protein